MIDEEKVNDGSHAAIVLNRWAWFFLIAGIAGGVIANFALANATGLLVGLGILIALIFNGCFLFSILRAASTMAEGISILRRQSK
jgi:hypothetical protein